MKEGHAWQGSMCGWGREWQGACMAGETATAADGTHSIGMHSYFLLFSDSRKAISLADDWFLPTTT